MGIFTISKSVRQYTFQNRLTKENIEFFTNYISYNYIEAINISTSLYTITTTHATTIATIIIKILFAYFFIISYYFDLLYLSTTSLILISKSSIALKVSGNISSKNSFR